MDKISLALLLEESANKYADRTVLISDDKRVIYSQLNRNVNAVAHLLRETGVVKGDKVALMLPNIPEFFYCYFAAVKLGAVAVPLNTSSTPYELNHLLENSDAKVLMTVEAARKRYEEIQNKLSTCQNLITVDSPAENSPFRKALKSGNFSNPAQTISPDDPAAIIYTSGLTGKSLGAVLTHRNLYSQSHLIHSCVKRTHLDIGLSLIPLFHSFGSTVNMINVIRTGCSVVMMDRFTMDGLFSAIQKEKITYICAVPRLYLGMMFHEGAANYDVSSHFIFIQYHYEQYSQFGPNCILGWFNKIFLSANYWNAVLCSPRGAEVDYIGTGGMIIDRSIFDLEQTLQCIPEPFCRVEDLYLSYIARMKYGMKLISIDKKCTIIR